MALARFVSVALALSACATPAESKKPAPDLVVAPTSAGGAWSSASWGHFHSKRFNVDVPLPDGKSWKIDDHKSDDLVAVEPATGSRLTLRATYEEGLMNRARCEARARALGVVPDAADATFTTVSDDAWTGPDAYDSRVWVAVDASRPDSVVGHVFLFGSFVRRCLLVHFSTTVPAKQEETLAERLAVAEEKIVKAIRPDAPRTNEDAELPKEKPDIFR